MDAKTRWDKIKKHKYSWITAIVSHILIVFFIFNSKGCVEIQLPPEFTLQEVVMDFTEPPKKPIEKGGGDEGASKPVEDPEPPSGKEESTQDESPVESSDGSTDTESDPKYNTSNLFGEGNSDQGTGDGGGDGMGDGTGPNTQGTGLGNGDYRTINSRTLKNPGEGSAAAEAIKWNGGYVMVKFIILINGKVDKATVLRTHAQTSITMTNAQKSMIEKQCKQNFKFDPVSSSKGKEQVVLRIQFQFE
jgi:hypothetical protein